MGMGSWDIAAAPRSAAALWVAALAAIWQLAGAGAALAEESQPQVEPERIVVVEPGTEPRLLYALDAGQMSVSELRPGSMDRAQLKVYLSMVGTPVDRYAAMLNPTLVMVAALQQQQQSSGAEAASIQTAAAVEYSGKIMPRSYQDADGTWVFPRLPGADEREILGFDPWRVEENPESLLLFLGPDRKFGLDDFADLINPLQHVPLVNIAYRAITGDEIYGAARLLDAGFGPAAAVAMVADLAITDTTGSGVEDHAMAALFGPAEGIGTENLAWAPIETGEQLAFRPSPRRGSNQ